MMMYDMTTQYQAAQVKTAAEQRRADEQLGMMAAGRPRRGSAHPPGSGPARQLGQAGSGRRERQVKQSTGDGDQRGDARPGTGQL